MNMREIDHFFTAAVCNGIPDLGDEDYSIVCQTKPRADGGSSSPTQAVLYRCAMQAIDT